MLNCDSLHMYLCNSKIKRFRKCKLHIIIGEKLTGFGYSNIFDRTSGN